MRWERLGRTPVPWVEVEVDDRTLIMREGLGADHHESRQTFDSGPAARHQRDFEEQKLRDSGFVRINRVAPAPPPESVEREERFDWQDGDTKRFRVISQRDEAVRIVDGELRGEDEWRGKPQTTKAFDTREASGNFKRAVERTQTEMQRGANRTQRLAQKRSVRAQGRRPSAHVHAALEAECHASPTAVAPWQVYADWLLEHGNPLGEIASLALAGDLRAATFAAQDHFEELDPSKDRFIELGLVQGFIRRVGIRSHLPGALATQVSAVLASPACRFVDDVSVMSAGLVDGQWRATLAALAAAPQAKRLQAIAFDAAEDEERRYLDYGELSFAPFTALARLRISGGALALGALPPLREYIRETDDLGAGELDALLAASHPRLERLVLGTGRESDVDLGRLLAADRVPALRDLGITESDLIDGLFEPLATSPLLAQLHALDLSDGNAAGEAARALSSHAARFRHLASLDLSRNLLEYGDEQRVRAVLDNVILAGQRDRYDDVDE